MLSQYIIIQYYNLLRVRVTQVRLRVRLKLKVSDTDSILINKVNFKCSLSFSECSFKLNS